MRVILVAYSIRSVIESDVLSPRTTFGFAEVQPGESTEEASARFIREEDVRYNCENCTPEGVTRVLELQNHLELSPVEDGVGIMIQIADMLTTRRFELNFHADKRCQRQ